LLNFVARCVQNKLPPLGLWTCIGDSQARFLAHRCGRPGSADARRVGVNDEWHLVVPNLFRHFTFQHPARLHHLVKLDRRAFSLARLESVRSISDAMKCDGVEQLLVEGVTESGVTPRPMCGKMSPSVPSRAACYPVRPAAMGIKE
jgi:hypothetical protein